MKNLRQRIWIPGIAALVLALGACDDAFGPGLEVEIGEVVLRVGDTSTTVRAGGSGTLTVDEGTHDVTVNVRDSSDRLVQLGIDYELQIQSGNQGVARYSELSNLEGTLVTAPGTTTLQVRIQHGSHSHFAAPVTVTVN